MWSRVFNDGVNEYPAGTEYSLRQHVFVGRGCTSIVLAAETAPVLAWCCPQLPDEMVPISHR